MSFNEQGAQVTIDYKTVGILQKLFLDMSSCRGKPNQLENTERIQYRVGEILCGTVMKQLGGLRLMK